MSYFDGQRILCCQHCMLSEVSAEHAGCYCATTDRSASYQDLNGTRIVLKMSAEFDIVKRAYML